MSATTRVSQSISPHVRSNLHDPSALAPAPAGMYSYEYNAPHQLSSSQMGGLALHADVVRSRRTSLASASGLALALAPAPFVAPVIDQLDTLNDTVSL